MEKKKRIAWGGATTTCMGAVLLLAAASANAFTFGAPESGITGAFDTDITFGMMQRMDGAGGAFAAEGNASKVGGTTSSSFGNRTLFKDRGDIISKSIRVSHTLQVDKEDYGFLGRLNYFYDFTMRSVRDQLPKDSIDRLVYDISLTDAVFYKDFRDQGLKVKIGKQVISWGESTFIGGSLADVNTVDVNKTRQPGIELKDAFIGTNAIDVAWNFADNWSTEAFVLTAHDPTRFDAAGSPFATDFLGRGGQYDDAGNGVIDGSCKMADGGDCGLLGMTRSTTRKPKRYGQWGFAIRHYLPGFFNGGEVAAYVMSLHDHNPMISTYKGSKQYILDYIQNIRRYGVSFNTNVATMAVSGEYSLRKGIGVQLFAPIVAGIAPGGDGSYQQGYERVDRHQVQVTFQKDWSVVHAINASGAATILELAGGWVDRLPSKAAMFDEQSTKSFYGFQVSQNATFSSALFDVVTVIPRLSYKFDINGTSPEFGGKVFVEGRQALTLASDFSYMNDKYRATIAYAAFFGSHKQVSKAGSPLNGSYDRDFLQASINMSF